jgi:hypothetical protein
VQPATHAILSRSRITFNLTEIIEAVFGESDPNSLDFS